SGRGLPHSKTLRGLTDADQECIVVCMRTTLNLDDDLMAQAQEYTGIKEKTRLLHRGLEALIQQEAARRLAAMGGTMPDLEVPPRRRSTLLPVSKARGGLTRGFDTLRDAVAAVE